eukprot:scaffold452_cov235-Pinguiococcus_pyrenoidosus.AAC.10
MTSAVLLLLCAVGLASASSSPRPQARPVSRREPVSRMPIAMLPIDSQATRMSDFRRQSLEKKETFNEDEELFGRRGGNCSNFRGGNRGFIGVLP